MITGEQVAEKMIEKNTVANSNIWDKAVLLNLSTRKFGVSKKVPMEMVQVDADKRRMSASKKIVTSASYKAILDFYTSTSQYVVARSLPSLFKSGVYLIRISAVEEIDDYLVACENSLSGLVDAFVVEWEDLVQQAKVALRVLFDARDYPDAETVRASFGLSHMWVECSTPGSLDRISRAVFDREREKAQEQWGNAIEQGKVVLREALADLTGHLIERLRPGEDGKRKKFWDSTVTNLQDWLKLFDFKDIADDGELRSMVERCSRIVGGVDPQALRDNDGVRAQVSADIAEVKGVLDTMIVARPVRKLSLFDDSEYGEYGAIL